ncbi:hypothetical protein ADK64_11055 [Streptomyces sp. MMG1121]|nr:hypothetical protein ADK64_11055 [Streptomyces sp. MMG1121]
MVIVGLGQAQFAEDAAHVLLDGALGDPETACDTDVGPTLRQQGQYLALACAQRVERIPSSLRRDQFLNQGGIHDGSVLGDPPDRLQELLHVGDPALEQIPDPPTAGQQLHGLLHLDMRGQMDSVARNAPAGSWGWLLVARMMRSRAVPFSGATTIFTRRDRSLCWPPVWK